VQISDIAYRCGFSTPAHFSRAFRKRYGVSPREALAGGCEAAIWFGASGTHVERGESGAASSGGTVSALLARTVE
jgi:AraC-like DNA-binding protein